jgi:hypothetical protein
MREINNNIQESYCSFEVSKLLKEKGFDCYTTTWHQRGNGIVEDVVGKSDRYNSKGEAYTSHPTHALALEWLRVNFGIWIMIEPDTANSRCWFPIVSKEYVGDGNTDFFNTPQEALEAALLYVLKNLI